MHSSELIYENAGSTPVFGNTEGICRITGQQSKGILFNKWVKDTFTDVQNLKPGTIVSNAALFCFDEQSEAVARKAGKFYASPEEMYESEQKKIADWQKKNKTTSQPSPKDIGYAEIPDGIIALQHFRTYSHILADNQWYVLSKADKRLMYELITTKNPNIVCLADSGQKHLIFKNVSGMWQLEDMSMLPDVEKLISLHHLCSDLLELGISQTEIITGVYKIFNIDKAGINCWREKETLIKPFRGSKIFQFVSFLMFNHNKQQNG